MPSLKPAYLLSGLGVDERVFARLSLAEREMRHIMWIHPLPQERMEAYAQRLLSQVDHPDPLLIGLSFGGMMAIEIGKLIRPEKVILISSAKTYQELPRQYGTVLKKTGMHQLLPISFFIRHNPLNNFLFGLKTKEERGMLRAILQDTDPIFLRWAVNHILNWKNIQVPENTFHIHGDADRLIPIRNVAAGYVIKDGGHFMVYNRAEEISKLLNNIISI